MDPQIARGGFQPPEMDKISQVEYAPLIVKLRAGNKYYPGLLVNGLAFATVRELETRTDISLCLTLDSEKDKCIETEGVGRNDEEKRITFVKVLFGPQYSEELKSMITKADPSTAEACVCVSFRHPPKKIRITEHMMVEGTGCMAMDGAFCDYKYLGAVVENVGPETLVRSERLNSSRKEKTRFERSSELVVLKITYLMTLAKKYIGDDTSADEFKGLVHTTRSNQTVPNCGHSNYYNNLVLLALTCVICTVLHF
ncbi:hypothetical protein Trydic_g17337 [Trypoxylus dichotomus]